MHVIKTVSGHFPWTLPRTFPQTFLLPPSLIPYTIGRNNCHESNFYLSTALLSSIQLPSIRTKNVFHQMLGHFLVIFVIIKRFRYTAKNSFVSSTYNLRRIVSSIQLLLNKDSFHQSDFYLSNVLFINLWGNVQRGNVRRGNVPVPIKRVPACISMDLISHRIEAIVAKAMLMIFAVIKLSLLLLLQS